LWKNFSGNNDFVPGQDLSGITTTGGFAMDEQAADRKKDTGKGMDKWPSTFLKLVGLELVLSVIFISLGYISGNQYFRGVGIGLLIAWVTGAIAYFIVKRRG
jgi:hypothetical protein